MAFTTALRHIRSVGNALMLAHKISCLSFFKENFITIVHTVIIEGRVDCCKKFGTFSVRKPNYLPVVAESSRQQLETHLEKAHY
jgi:hypothetical protein